MESGSENTDLPVKIVPATADGLLGYLCEFRRPKVEDAITTYLKKLKLKLNKTLDENSSLSYGASSAIWDHTVLPATRHK